MTYLIIKKIKYDLCHYFLFSKLGAGSAERAEAESRGRSDPDVMPFYASDARPDIIKKPLVLILKLRVLKLGAGNELSSQAVARQVLSPR